MSQKQDPVNEVKATIPQGEVQWPHFPENPPASNVFARWLKLLTHPDLKTYAEEGSDADLITPVFNALLFAAFFVVYLLVQVILIDARQLGGDLVYLLFLMFIAILGSVAGMFAGTTILYTLARTIGGGTGSYTAQTYIFSMYNTPLAIISILLSQLGQVGAILAYAVGVYELFLTYIMVRTIHRSSPLRAVLTAIGYGVIATLLVILLLYLQISGALGL